MVSPLKPNCVAKSNSTISPGLPRPHRRHLQEHDHSHDDEQPDEHAQQVVLHLPGLQRPQPGAGPLPQPGHPVTAPSMTLSSNWCHTQREPSTAGRTKVAA